MPKSNTRGGAMRQTRSYHSFIIAALALLDVEAGEHVAQ